MYCREKACLGGSCYSVHNNSGLKYRLSRSESIVRSNPVVTFEVTWASPWMNATFGYNFNLLNIL